MRRVRTPWRLYPSVTVNAALDANVLLNPYKLDADTRDKWLDLLEQLGTNHQSLWISHQAVKEFWNNRTTAAMFTEVIERDGRPVPRFARVEADPV